MIKYRLLMVFEMAGIVRDPILCEIGTFESEQALISWAKDNEGCLAKEREKEE